MSDKVYGIHGGKYGRYFQVNCSRYEPYWFCDPAFDRTQEVEILNVNDEVYPPEFGDFSFGGGYKIKPEPKGTGHPQNYHEGTGETLLFFSTDPENPENLGGEIEMCIESDKHIISRTSAVYIPERMLHGPLWFRDVSRPIIQMAMLCAPTYGQHYAGGLEQEPILYHDRNGGHGAYIMQNPNPPVRREDGTIEVLKVTRDQLPEDVTPVEVEYLIHTRDCVEGPETPVVFENDVAIAIFDLDKDHARELDAEVIVSIGDEIHVVREPFILTLPAGIPLGPIRFKDVGRPIVHIVTKPPVRRRQSTGANAG